MISVLSFRLSFDLQSFPKAIDEGLEEGFVMRNGLQDVPISRDITDSPLAEPRTAQPEDIAVTKGKTWRLQQTITTRVKRNRTI